MDIKVKLICKKCGSELKSDKSISMYSTETENEVAIIELLIVPCECCLANAKKQGRKDNEPIYALKGQQAKYIGDSVSMLGLIPGATYEISRAKKHDGILIISLTGFGDAEFNSKYFEINCVLPEKQRRSNK